MRKIVIVTYGGLRFKKYQRIHDYATIDLGHLQFSGNIVHFYGEATLAIL